MLYPCLKLDPRAFRALAHLSLEETTAASTSKFSWGLPQALRNRDTTNFQGGDERLSPACGMKVDLNDVPFKVAEDTCQHIGREKSLLSTPRVPGIVLRRNGKVMRS